MNDVFLFSSPINDVSFKNRYLSSQPHCMKFLKNRNIDFDPSVTIEDIKKYFDEYTSLIYFSGHCFPELSSIAFFKDDKQIDTVNLIEYLGNCSKRELKLVYLDCCESESIAYSISLEFPDTMVIAWETKVDDLIAYSFFKEYFTNFYDLNHDHYRSYCSSINSRNVNFLDSANHTCIPCFYKNGKKNETDYFYIEENKCNLKENTIKMRREIVEKMCRLQFRYQEDRELCIKDLCDNDMYCKIYDADVPQFSTNPDKFLGNLFGFLTI